MNSKKRDSSPSTEPSDTSQKRQKSDIADDPSVSSLLPSTPQPTDLNHSNKSDFSAAAKARFDKIKSAKELLYNEEQKILEEAKVCISENERLKLRVMILRKCLEAADDELSRVKIEKDNKIKELEEQAKRDTETLEAARIRLIELRQNATSESSCQEQLKLNEMELTEAKEKILKLEAERKSLWEEVQELLPKAQRAKELEKKLQSLTEVPPKAVQVVEPCKSSSVAGKTEQQVAPVKWVKCKTLPSVNALRHSLSPKNLLTLPNSRVNSLGKQSQNCQQKLLPLKSTSELKFRLSKFKINKTRGDQFGNLKKNSLPVPKSGGCLPQNKKEESQQKCEAHKAKEREMAKGNTELDPKTAKNETPVPVIKKGLLKGVNRSSWVKFSDDKNARQNRLNSVPKFSLLASDSRFVRTNWSTNYQNSSQTLFKCTCDLIKRSRVMAGDHICVKHYGG